MENFFDSHFIKGLFLKSIHMFENVDLDKWDFIQSGIQLWNCFGGKPHQSENELKNTTFWGWSQPDFEKLTMTLQKFFWLPQLLKEKKRKLKCSRGEFLDYGSFSSNEPQFFKDLFNISNAVTVSQLIISLAHYF